MDVLDDDDEVARDDVDDNEVVRMMKEWCCEVIELEDE